MIFQRKLRLKIQARVPSARERVVVVTEDPDFFFALRREAPDLDPVWMLAHSAREGLLAIQDPRVQVVVLDGALNDKPANQLMGLVMKIRPGVAIVFAYHLPREDWEREAREVGVLYYGDRSHPADMIRVVRESIRRSGRLRPRPHGMPSPGGS